MSIEIKRVKSKSFKRMKDEGHYSKTANRVAGDMDENTYMETKPHGEGMTCVKGFGYDEFEQEFLVVDHPNVITKQNYDLFKDLFEEVKENGVPKQHSFKGVF